MCFSGNYFLWFIFGVACFIVKLDKGFHLEEYDTDYLEIGILIPHSIQMCVETLYLPLTVTWIL